MESNIKEYLIYTLAKQIRMERKYGKSSKGSHKAHVSKARNATAAFVSEANVSQECKSGLYKRLDSMPIADLEKKLKPVKRPVVKMVDVEDSAPPSLYRIYEKSLFAYNGLRDFEILAIKDKRMLVEITMPSGKTYLRIYKYQKSPAKSKTWMMPLAEDSIEYEQLKKYSDLYYYKRGLFNQVVENDTYWMGIKACGKRNNFEFWGGSHSDQSGTKTAEDYFLGVLTIDGKQESVVLWVKYFTKKSGARVAEMAHRQIGKKKFVSMDLSGKVTFYPTNRLSPGYAKSFGITLKK